jgi:hypothetical protein
MSLLRAIILGNFDTIYRPITIPTKHLYRRANIVPRTMDNSTTMCVNSRTGDAENHALPALL